MTVVDGQVLLDVDGIGKTYGAGETTVEAVRSLTFQVRRGEFCCIVGPSGCGKTTLLRMLSGLLAPSVGSRRLDGVEIDRPSDRLALVFQDYSRSLLPWMTVRRNVELPLRSKRLGGREQAARAAEALEAVGLASAADRFPWQLSGGMQQRAAIARALAYQPEILLMDEPFASVDAQTRADLEDLVLDVWQRMRCTVLFVTHDIDESVYLADRVIVLSKPPSVVAEVVDIDLPRPRDQLLTRDMPEFAHLRSHVYRLVRRPDDEAAEAARARGAAA